MRVVEVGLTLIGRAQQLARGSRLGIVRAEFRGGSPSHFRKLNQDALGAFTGQKHRGIVVLDAAK